ncbi:MAG: hydroxyisourate hydrolase [Gammaproteobacteria bacterium]
MTNAGGISIHAIDVSRGVPANGLKVSLYRLDGNERILIAQGACGTSGTLVHPVAQGEGVIAGIYEAVFDIGGFFRAQGVEIPDPAFLESTSFRFGIATAQQHYHLPLKFTPWGYSLFRGGA